MFKVGQKIQIKQGTHPLQSLWIGRIGFITEISIRLSGNKEYGVESIYPEDPNYPFPDWLYEDEMILLEDHNEISIF